MTFILKSNQKVFTKWNSRNKKYYCEKGYVFTKMNDVLEIDVKDLIPNSHINIIAICDYCGEEFAVSMTNYTRSTKNNNKIACKHCKAIKTKETLIEKHGVSVSFLIPEVQTKIKNNNLIKYGSENCLSNPEIREKVKNTMKEKYGVEFPSQSLQILGKIKESNYLKYGVFCVFNNKEIKENINNTMLQKYGANNPGLVPKFVEKAKDTCMRKYGGKSSQCSKEIRDKSMKSLREHGNIPSSKSERLLIDMLKTTYGEQCCKEQYVLDKLFLDCLIIVNNIKIDVEYDGWYWHKKRKDEDKRRDYYVIKQGIKLLRYRSNKSLPSITMLKKDIQKLTTTNKHLIIRYLDNIQEGDIV